MEKKSLKVTVLVDKQYCDSTCPYLASDNFGNPTCELFRYYFSESFPNKPTPLHYDGVGVRRLYACLESET